MTVQRSLVWEHKLGFKIGHKAVGATKHICCGKSKGAVDQSTVNRLLKKVRSGFKNITDQAKSGGIKTVDLVPGLQAPAHNSLVIYPE